MGVFMPSYSWALARFKVQPFRYAAGAPMDRRGLIAAALGLREGRAEFGTASSRIEVQAREGGRSSAHHPGVWVLPTIATLAGVARLHPLKIFRVFESRVPPPWP